MPFNKPMIRNLFVLFAIFALSYFSTLYFVNISYIKEFDTETFQSSFVFQTIVFSIIFILLTSIFIYYKIKNKKPIIDTKVKSDSEIQKENDKLKSSLTVDLLTSLVNHKGFEERFEEEYKRAIRDKQYLSFMIVDIDDFRAFNDIYGKDEGNECLKMIANILVSQCNRPCDLVARIRKDEFYILLPNTQDAKTVSQKCVKAVNDMQIPHENSIASNVLTISIGVSEILPIDIIQKNQLIANAKSALMSAKRSGRNRVA